LETLRSNFYQSDFSPLEHAGGSPCRAGFLSSLRLPIQRRVVVWKCFQRQAAEDQSADFFACSGIAPAGPKASSHQLAGEFFSINQQSQLVDRTVVRKREEELHFHERSTPFVQSSPQVLHAFRRKLADTNSRTSADD
jgi:hypothetical protein